MATGGTLGLEPAAAQRSDDWRETEIGAGGYTEGDNWRDAWAGAAGCTEE